MLRLPLTKIWIEGRGEIDLGQSPAGYMNEHGHLYTYDGYIVNVKNDDKIKAYDEDGVAFDAESIEELIEEVDMLDAWEEV